MNRDEPIYLSVKYAARLAGLKERAVYTAITKKKMPAEEDLFDGSKRLKIPAEAFLTWMEFYIQRHECQARQVDLKLRNLKLSYQQLKEKVNYGHS